MDNVLITGGSGTLGHALVARWYGNTDITIYSRSELLQAKMRAKYPKCRFILGDVRDYPLLSSAIAGHDTVIHAAAMKRIPECEQWPGLCNEVNVIGSEYVARACGANNVTRCVGISTDKACLPITAYGASKLAMEKIFQARTESDTIFTLVRYGNVLESRGSVVELWRNQATNGGPITITDRLMSRFWLTPGNAARYAELALGLAQGEIYVPKLQAAFIGDMAKWIAPHAEVYEIGLRSQERYHEYLVSGEERGEEYDDHFIIGHIDMALDDYTSANCDRLSQGEFMGMWSEVNE